MIKVLVFGATGRMGLEVIKAISDSKTFKLVAAISSPSSKYLTHDSGVLSCDRVNEVLISGSLTDISGDVDLLLSFVSCKTTSFIWCCWMKLESSEVLYERYLATLNIGWSCGYRWLSLHLCLKVIF